MNNTINWIAEEELAMVSGGRIQGADYADDTGGSTKQQDLQNAGQAVLNQANQIKLV